MSCLQVSCCLQSLWTGSMRWWPLKRRGRRPRPRGPTRTTRCPSLPPSRWWRASTKAWCQISSQVLPGLPLCSKVRGSTSSLIQLLTHFASHSLHIITIVLDRFLQGHGFVPIIISHDAFFFSQLPAAVQQLDDKHYNVAMINIQKWSLLLIPRQIWYLLNDKM